MESVIYQRVYRFFREPLRLRIGEAQHSASSLRHRLLKLFPLASNTRSILDVVCRKLIVVNFTIFHPTLCL